MCFCKQRKLYCRETGLSEHRPYIGPDINPKPYPKLAAAAKTVAKEKLYTNSWWHGNLAKAVATISDTAMGLLIIGYTFEIQYTWNSREAILLEVLTFNIYKKPGSYFLRMRSKFDITNSQRTMRMSLAVLNSCEELWLWHQIHFAERLQEVWTRLEFFQVTFTLF